MRAIWTLARKEFRLLLRDRVAAVLLLGMPLLFVLVLGLLLGEGFGQKTDERLRISIVDEDRGVGLHGKPWGHWVQADLRETPDIRIEILPDLATAQDLIRNHRRAAVIVLTPQLSERLNRCSFLDIEGSINPFFREGVFLDRVGIEVLQDDTQKSAAAIITQVVQVSMLRVTLPYMIGQAFRKLSDEQFIKNLGETVRLPMPADFQKMLKSANELLPLAKKMTQTPFIPASMGRTVTDLGKQLKKFAPLLKKDRIKLAEMIELASSGDPKKEAEYRAKVGEGVKAALEKYFIKYNLTGMTWADLVKAKESKGQGAAVQDYVNREGSGFLSRGAMRYQVLVPSYTVMFAFFLVLTVGWVFVAERRQGTLKRLRAAPLTRAQILLGKLIPCYLLSVGQGIFLLAAGRLLFGMRWGPQSWPLAEQCGWLLLVIASTSLAAMGLALLVAAVARSEIQVAIFGAVPVLVLALIGGCVLPREMMPAGTQKLTLIAPQGWSLEAYRELLDATGQYQPNLAIVLQACGVLAAFGVVFLGLAWSLLRLE